MERWLLNRLYDFGGQPTPRFAFQGTVNWMRALSILVEGKDFEDNKIKEHYQGVQRRVVNIEADTRVFESMLMAFHNHAALVSFNQDVVTPYNICRSAIVSWYYSIYFTCSAMNEATSGSRQESHGETAKVWHSNIVKKKLLLSPFSLKLSSLVKETVKGEISEYRQGNDNYLNDYPENKEQAWGAVVSYLDGTWKYQKDKKESEIRKQSEFKNLGVINFRKKEARELRDGQLAKHGVNFLLQAFRYRGKANYRDSIFLSYGGNQSEKIKTLCQDLENVSSAFQRMAAYYLSKKVEKGSWQQFVNDLGKHSRLSIDTNILAV